jgi:hypothetical protein
VQSGLAVLDIAIAQQDGDQGRARVRLQAEDVIELEADDLFELVSIVMGLADSEARRIGMAGLVDAVRSEDFGAFQIRCLAVRQFCGWASPPSAASH